MSDGRQTYSFYNELSKLKGSSYTKNLRKSYKEQGRAKQDGAKKAK
jgi:hypothetical protein